MKTHVQGIAARFLLGAGFVVVTMLAVFGLQALFNGSTVSSGANDGETTGLYVLKPNTVVVGYGCKHEGEWFAPGDRLNTSGAPDYECVLSGDNAHWRNNDREDGLRGDEDGNGNEPAGSYAGR